MFLSGETKPNKLGQYRVYFMAKDYTKEFGFCGNKAGNPRAGKKGPSWPLG